MKPERSSKSQALFEVIGSSVYIIVALFLIKLFVDIINGFKAMPLTFAPVFLVILCGVLAILMILAFFYIANGLAIILKKDDDIEESSKIEDPDHIKKKKELVKRAYDDDDKRPSNASDVILTDEDIDEIFKEENQDDGK